MTAPSHLMPAPGARREAPAPSEVASHPVASLARARVAVLGATGYSGQEFVRLALGHDGIDLAVLCSRESHGEAVRGAFPGLDDRAIALPEFAELEDLPALAEACAFDTLVSCLPHGALAELLAAEPDLAERAARIVDLSGDHRDGASGFLYGLPEAHRATIAGASRVANPGCYPTAAGLALLPALERGWVGDPVMVSALSGASGAGRAATLASTFVELEGGAALYRVGTEHAHVAEMERLFALVGRGRYRVAFAPQIVPMARGILVTVTAPLDRPVTPQEAHEAYEARYLDEPFVRVLEAGTWPATRAVRASNRCDVAITTLHAGHTLLATAALDNLVKGAAGQAIQNLNLMLGRPEAEGLPRHGSPW